MISSFPGKVKLYVLEMFQNGLGYMQIRHLAVVPGGARLGPAG
jgi:hypothetical protein